VIKSQIDNSIPPSSVPPSDEGGGTAHAVTVGENQEEKISPPVFLLRKNPAPSSEGASSAFLTAFAICKPPAKPAALTYSRSRICALGLAPNDLFTTLPSLMTNRVGMLTIPY